MENRPLKKPVGKAAEPTAEELEFIYSRLKLSDSEVLEEMQDQPFPLRSKGFIKRRRREFDVAKKVLRAQLEKELDPVKAKMREEHYRKMADVAYGILKTTLYDIDDMRENPGKSDRAKEYICGAADDDWPYDRNQLGGLLRENILIASGRKAISLREWEDVNIVPEATDLGIREAEFKTYPQHDFKHLVEHLKKECPIIRRKGLDSAVKQDPYAVIEALRVISRRKTVKGKCTICKGL